MLLLRCAPSVQVALLTQRVLERWLVCRAVAHPVVGSLAFSG